MATSYGSRGQIVIYDDFVGPEIAVAGTDAGPLNLGNLILIGDGLDAGDAGAVQQGAINGVLRLTADNADNKYCKIGTDVCFDVALMAPLVLETRVKMPALTTRRVFAGFANDATGTSAVECEANSGTVTNTMSSFVGLLFDSGATLSSSWLCCYNGGSTTALTTEQTTGKTAVANEWDTLRVEVFPDGRTRFFVNLDFIKEVEGAVSTTTDLAGYVGVGSVGTAANGTCDVDYVYITANRDWTR